eukprot:TRINITY_DN14624_c0_g1_i1.p1 TRINITY_DN14624_c0_g1~~TRINITY_DN14624_c0_g1_i1.p1  ORF type:complete len:163 (+),score=11.79 TRINITY_DN14624_c0_g1_i1:1098-1586(+)
MGPGSMRDTVMLDQVQKQRLVLTANAHGVCELRTSLMLSLKRNWQLHQSLLPVVEGEEEQFRLWFVGFYLIRFFILFLVFFTYEKVGGEVIYKDFVMLLWDYIYGVGVGVFAGPSLWVQGFVIRSRTVIFFLNPFALSAMPVPLPTHHHHQSLVPTMLGSAI